MVPSPRSSPRPASKCAAAAAARAGRFCGASTAAADAGEASEGTRRKATRPRNIPLAARSSPRGACACATPGSARSVGLYRGWRIFRCKNYIIALFEDKILGATLRASGRSLLSIQRGPASLHRSAMHSFLCRASGLAPARGGRTLRTKRSRTGRTAKAARAVRAAGAFGAVRTASHARRNPREPPKPLLAPPPNGKTKKQAIRNENTIAGLWRFGCFAAAAPAARPPSQMMRLGAFSGGGSLPKALSRKVKNFCW